ncbi:unnamed protein product, partial [Polarella glacialis]
DLPTAPAAELPITLRIPAAETERGFLGQGYISYVVEVEAFGAKSEVRHPFEAFEKLHEEFAQFFRTFPSEVRKKLSYALPPLPSTCWYKPDSPRTVDERRSKLESLLQRLLQQAEVVNDKEERLWKFLQLPAEAAAAARLLTTKTDGPWLQRLCDASWDSEGRLLPSLRHPAVE